MVEMVKDDLTLAKQIKDQIDADTKMLQAKKENLESQIHQLQIQLESDKKYKDIEFSRRYEEKEEEIKRRQNQLDILADTLKNKELSIENRLKNVEQQEKKVGIYEELMRRLDKERQDFMIYKAKVEKELESARVTIEEAKGLVSHYENEEESLRNRERQIQIREEDLDRRTGVLAEKERQFEIEKSSKK